MNTLQPVQQNERPHLDTMTAGAWLPFTQASIIALVVGVGVFVIAWLVFDVMDPHKPALLIAVIAWVAMLVKLQRHWLSRTTGIIERIIERDINNDGVIGQPEEVKPRKVTIDMSTISRDKGYQSNRINFPGSEEQLQTLAAGLLNGMTFTERNWSGNGKLYTSPEFRELKTVMFAHGLIEYVSEADKRQGIRLTEKGGIAMRELSNSPTPPEDVP